MKTNNVRYVVAAAAIGFAVTSFSAQSEAGGLDLGGIVGGTLGGLSGSHDGSTAE